MLKYTDCSEYYEVEAVVLGDTMGERVEAEALARLATAIVSVTTGIPVRRDVAMTRPSALCRGCGRAGRGGEGQ